jgi:hypothetical protein
MLIAVLLLSPPPFNMLMHLHGHGCLGFNNALLCLCLFTLCATTPLLEQQEVQDLAFFRIFTVVLAGGGV